MSLGIDITGLDLLIRRVESLKKSFDAKRREFLTRLADIGVNTAAVTFSTAEYDGDRSVAVTAEWADDATLEIKASGKSVLFIEFGSGLIGSGHERAADLGYGPGTWSEGPLGKGHWNDPNGWYYEHGKKSRGNPPARAMYSAGKEMRAMIAQTAREVFSAW